MPASSAVVVAAGLHLVGTVVTVKRGQNTALEHRLNSPASANTPR
jgi:hypothetical protein